MQYSKTTSSTSRHFLTTTYGLLLISILVEASIIYNLLANLDLPDRPWQFYAGPLLPLPLLIAALISLSLARRDQIHQAIRILAAGLIMVNLAVPFFIADRATPITFLITTIIITLVTMVKDEKLSTQLILAASGSGILAIIIDLIAPVQQLSGGNIRPIGMYALVAGTAGFVVFIIRQFPQFQLQMKMILLFMILPVMIVATITFLRIFLVNDLLEERAVTAVTANLEERSSAVTEQLENVTADLRFLSQSATLQRYLELLDANDDSAALETVRTQLNQEFLAFATAGSIYDQVRYIDATGQEIIRADRNQEGEISIVSENQLQNKADRYYFANTIQLQPDEIFISPLDLNVEQGAIEIPYKPMIRYGMPVVYDGEKTGIVIINVLANVFLEDLACDTYCSLLVDADGYYLHHPDQSLRWGRDLGHETRLAGENPELAAAILGEERGTLSGEGFLYAYQPVTLPTETTPRWTLVSQITQEAAYAPLSNVLTVTQAMMMIALLITPAIGLVVSKRLTQPLLEITASTEKLSQGEWDVELNIERQDEIGQLARVFGNMAQQLRASLKSLQQLSTEQTRDLTLAAEVGHQVAHIRNLDELLAAAAELIRARFELYYTQIYLVDEEAEALVLRAGTGEVGQTLLNRQFTLPLSTSSINGTAAIEKQPVIVADTAVSPIFRPNQLLPDTRSEMAVPLLSQNHVVGVLNLQSDKPQELSDKNLRAFEVLAGQLAVAIENARLLAQARQIQQSAESHAQQLTRSGWELFLDGIYHDKYMGYRYTGKQLSPLESALDTTETAVAIPITIVGEKIGAIMVDPDTDHPLSDEDEVLLSIVAQQVGQRLENLRLLDETDRFREQAEEAVRRLTRDGWLDYQDKLPSLGYQFERRKVEALPENEDRNRLNDAQIVQPLQIRGETIGQLAIDNVQAPVPNTQEMVSAVIEQLLTHIENLRLTEQTQLALQETEVLYEAGAQLNAAKTYEDILRVLKKHTAPGKQAQQIGIGYFNEPWTTTQKPEYFSVIAYLSTRQDSLTQSVFMLRDHPKIIAALKPDQPILIEDVRHTPLFGDYTRKLYLKGFGCQCTIFIPLVAGGQWLGFVNAMYAEPTTFTQEEIQQLMALAKQAAVTIQTIRLFDETNQLYEREQSRAQREQMLREVATRIRNATGVDAVLQTAVQEIGKSLGRKAFVHMQPTEEEMPAGEPVKDA